MTNNSQQTFKPILRPVSEVLQGAGNKATVLGYEDGHAFMSFVPKPEVGYVHSRAFLREYLNWHNDPGEMGFMVVGPTGCGKSTAILAVNSHYNIPTLLVSCHRDMTINDLQGTMQFVTDKETKQSVTKFVLGPLARAFKYGFTVILDENNMLDPDVNAGLNEVVRGKTMLIEQTGELIHRHPMFRIIASANDWGRGDGEMRQAGQKLQNSAYLNRYWKFKMNYPIAEEEKKILESKLPDLPEDIRNGMVDVANMIRPTIRGVGDDPKMTKLDLDFSTRTVIEWADKTLRFGAVAPNPVKYALEIVLLRVATTVEKTTIERACRDKLGRLYDNADA
jgi:cobaltochelatase CobS